MHKYIKWENFGRFDSPMITSTEGNNKERQLGYYENILPYYTRDRFPAYLFKFTEEEMDVINNKWVDIKSYHDEMCGKFIVGIENIDEEWDNYIATLKKMGIDDVIAVYQAAYDRWNSL